MRCLPINMIYEYLEDELSPQKKEAIARHLSTCAKCKNAVEERQRLLEASYSLPSWETPSEFTSQVISRIFPRNTSIWAWMAAAASGLMFSFLAFFVVFLVSRQNILSVSVSFSHSFLAYLENFFLIIVKFFKLVFLITKLVPQLVGYFLKGVELMITLLNPEIQIILVTLSILFSGLFIYVMRRNFLQE